MLGKISLQYESSYKNISTAKFYFKWLSLLYPRLLHFYFLRHTHWKNGKNCHLSSFYLFLKKSTQFIGKQQFFSVPPLMRTANCPLFLHSLSMQRIVPLMTWQVAGSRDFSNPLECMDLGKTVNAVMWKCSLASRANLLLIQTKMVHLRNTCRLTLPVLNTNHPLGFTLVMLHSKDTTAWW